MTKHTILNGDVIDCLKTLPDGSVQCVVTSPPYFGLRDYNTASWEGGDPGCDHNPQRSDGGERSDRALPLGRGGMYKDVCRKCGAVRVDKQIGLEDTPEAYVTKLVGVFREVRRVLRDDGTVWLNLGDSYNGSGKGAWDKTDVQKEVYVQPAGTPQTRVPGLKPKDLIGIPWRVAFALQEDGWYLRQDIIWHKPNPMPESVTDRCTKAHEYIFLITKSARYYYDAVAVKEANADPERTNYQCGSRTFGKNHYRNDNDMGERTKNWKPNGRNRRSVWTISTKPYEEAHFATFPRDLVEPCIKAGSAPGDTVMDIFGGSGTVAEVARDLDRSSISIELNPDYVKLIRKRLKMDQQLDTGIYEYETRVIS